MTYVMDSSSRIGYFVGAGVIYINWRLFDTCSLGNRIGCDYTTGDSGTKITSI